MSRPSVVPAHRHRRSRANAAIRVIHAGQGGGRRACRAPDKVRDGGAMRPRAKGIVMRKIGLILMTLVLAVGSTLVFSGASEAKTQGADLAVTGLVAGGETSTESFHLVVFVFTMTNNGPLATDGSADVVLTGVQGGTLVDAMCVLPNGFGINADSPACETGALSKKQRVQDTFVVQPSATATSVSLRACSINEGRVADPV